MYIVDCVLFVVFGVFGFIVKILMIFLEVVGNKVFVIVVSVIKINMRLICCGCCC